MTKNVISSTPALVVRDNTSLSDMAYNFVLQSEGREAIAKILAERYPGEELPEEVQDELKAGFKRRGFELDKGRETWVERTDRDTYVTLAGKPATLGDRHLCLSAEYCMGFTGPELTKLAKDQPNLHKMVTPVRKSLMTYISNRMQDLGRMIGKARNVAAGRPARAPMRDFDTFLSETIDAWKKKAATCKKAGLAAPEVTDDKLKRIKAAVAKILAE